VDFGLSSTIIGTREELSIKLLPYDISYFKGLSADFEWPEGVREKDGKPVVAVTGLLKTTDFVLS
jgi:hypothetical protein